jgi:DNA-binding response OmpR family regulator
MAIAAGATAGLRKPFTLQQLTAAVQTVLDPVPDRIRVA